MHQLGRQTIAEMSAALANINTNDPVDTGQWVQIDDFYQWYTRKLFAAAFTALCGPHLVRLSPNFVADICEYLELWPYFAAAIPTPAFLSKTVRRAHSAQQRVLTAIKVWHTYALNHSDYRSLDESHNDSWGEYWGSPMMWAGHRLGREVGMDDDALASYHMSVLIA